MRRHLRTCAYVLLMVGITTGLAGLLTHDGDLTTAGSIIAFAGVPGSIITSIDRAHRISDDQLAASHRDGYQLALRHVAAGLLDPRDQDTPPADGLSPARVANNLAPNRAAP
ncbi:hypothetical protein [Streptomyces iconiensis]|uniref:Uncharacterized protein n=1 Tax=Streptomyces iconiensis TaxID=1384038 RepID=A0ABT6ZSZ8_9ACTN|nr:hypothetical protein [Streptomyces iconiensis]MDJ1131756.1 hypothetical protein [Streptomyces iconiensis]